MGHSIISWLPDWAQRIASVVSGERTAEDSGPYQLCRCPVCGGPALLTDKTTSKGEEIRQCVRCGSLSKGEQ